MLLRGHTVHQIRIHVPCEPPEERAEPLLGSSSPRIYSFSAPLFSRSETKKGGILMLGHFLNIMEEWQSYNHGTDWEKDA